MNTIFVNTYKSLPDMLGTVYDMQSSERDTERMSQVGTFGDFDTFNGQVVSDDLYQGYDVTTTHIEFAKGFSVERKLYDDDLFDIFQKPEGLATAAQRTRQGHGARIFNFAFSYDQLFYTHTEGISLCNNSHTTTSGASTASGFDNLVTTAISGVNLSAMRLQFRGFRDDRANRIDSMPDTLFVPIDQEDRANEITKTPYGLDTGNRNINVDAGRYEVIPWNYITDTNNFFMVNKALMKKFLKWYDRIKLEFHNITEFDTFIAKWNAYMRYSIIYGDWRWIIGASVS